MAIDLEKLKAAALASINHDGSNYYSHTYNHTKASNPATIIELIERLEAAEFSWAGCSQQLKDACQDLEAAELERNAIKSEWEKAYEIAMLRQHKLEAAEKQRDELLSAVELYEEALKASWPSGAEYDAFEYWNYARKAIASVKEQK